MRGNCSSCEHLSDCKEAQGHKEDLDRHCCRSWRQAEEPERKARDKVIQEFGPGALRYMLADKDKVPKRR
jgi:uncharacterized Fe-S cluster protein YjdI